jgi:hypothetical protein
MSQIKLRLLVIAGVVGIVLLVVGMISIQALVWPFDVIGVTLICLGVILIRLMWVSVSQ